MMRVVIQDKGDFRYIRSETEWTTDSSEAFDFERIQKAAEFCHRHGLRQAYIVAGDYNAEAKRFNGGSKSVFDAKQFGSAPAS
jgi:hypothetical protein